MGTGTLTNNGFIYKPAETARGAAEKALYDAGLDRIDTRLGREVYVGDPEYATMAAAVASLNAVGADCTLVLPVGTHSVAADLTINSNVHIRAQKGAVLAIATTKTLTINGPFEAGLYQIFSCTGTGKVVFGPGSVQEVYVEWWGAKGDGVTDCYAAFTAALATGQIIRAPYGVYKIVGNLYGVEGGIIGANRGTAVDAQKTVLYMYNCTNTGLGAINTRYATGEGKNFRLENLCIYASSWDAVTGCLGYGLDIEAPIRAKNVIVNGFKKSNIWIHGTAGGGHPGQSIWENVESEYSGEHGCLVGGLGQNQTFINYQGKNNGASYVDGVLTAPTLGTHAEFDGFHIEGTADGNAGYPTNVPEGLVVLGGDCSYNGRYGWYFHGVSNSSMICPSYAEGNLAGGGGNGSQAALNNNILNSIIHFANLTPPQIDVVAATNDYNVSSKIWAGGRPVTYGLHNTANAGNYTLRQSPRSYTGSNNNDFSWLQPNNPAGQTLLQTYAKGALRIGAGANGVIETGPGPSGANNAVMLPYAPLFAYSTAKTITGVASNGGPNLIRLTVSSGAPGTGARVYVQGCIVCPNANGMWFVTNIDATTVDLVGSTYAAIATRGNSTAYAYGANVQWPTGVTLWQCVTAGTTAGSAPDVVGKVPGDFVIDGEAAWICTGINHAVAAPATRTDTTTYALGDNITWTTGTTLWQCIVAGETAGSPPSIVGKVVGDTVVDGGATWIYLAADRIVGSLQPCVQFDFSNAAAPTSGDRARGDRCFHPFPVISSGFNSLICLAQGTPGVWAPDYVLNQKGQVKTGDYTCNITTDVGNRFANTGAAGTVTFSLPAATVGLEYHFTRIAAQAVRIDPNGTEVIQGGGAGKYLSLNSDGASVSLKCVAAGVWQIVNTYGTTAFEA